MFELKRLKHEARCSDDCRGGVGGGCGKEEAQTNTTKGIPLRVGMEVVYQDRQGAAEKPEPPKDPIEAAIRMVLKNPTGSLTSADLEKVTELRIHTPTLTDVSTLAKLTQLRFINLNNNPKLTRAEIAKLQTALPDCDIVPKVTKQKRPRRFPAPTYCSPNRIGFSTNTIPQIPDLDSDPVKPLVVAMLA